MGLSNWQSAENQFGFSQIFRPPTNWQVCHVHCTFLSFFFFLSLFLSHLQGGKPGENHGLIGGEFSPTKLCIHSQYFSSSETAPSPNYQHLHGTCTGNLNFARTKNQITISKDHGIIGSTWTGKHGKPSKVLDWI